MSNFNRVQETLDRLGENLKTAAKKAKLGVMAADMIRDHIYKGEGFAPLSAATRAYRGDGQPLRDTTALLNSITSEQVNDTTISVGTTKVYAPIQNNGGVIRPKKGKWLWIPAAGTRQLQRRYGYSVTQVLTGLKGEGYSVYRAGRTVCYRKKGGKKKASKVVFYLKESVEIPARKFFYLSDEEINQLKEELGNELF
ncbi:MAG: hypothetical protein SPE30_07650 [Candidatus Treponema excrementipullorum]|nr:hypothetical protein [Candidatus Treponema excrementipullorum]MDY4707634.1 hypothetical protein [Candidatus Treponema excrementipullorum]